MKEVALHTDGVCEGNPGPGGYGVVLVYGPHRRELSGGYRKTTDYRLALTAAIKGLGALKEECKIQLHSHSKYVVDALSQGWAAQWRGNGWRRNDNELATNSDLWIRLLDLCESHDVTFHWVQGHPGNPDNERSNQLATEAATQPDLPADGPYEDFVPEQMEPGESSPATQRSQDAAAHSAKGGLLSAGIGLKRQTIFRAVEENDAEIAPALLELMKSERDPIIKGRCAWALGRLNYREAEPSLIAALKDPSVEVRKWSAWALGEIGSVRTEAHLRGALDREDVGAVRSSIGGALKKLNFEPTRVHVSQLTKALQPPKTTDSTLLTIMEQLEPLDLIADADEIIRLRTAMKERDPGFFKTYMDWVKRRPAIAAALKDDKKVFRS